MPSRRIPRIFPATRRRRHYFCTDCDSLQLIGVLRLRSGFAPRSRHSAQDDRLQVLRNRFAPASSGRLRLRNAALYTMSVWFRLVLAVAFVFATILVATAAPPPSEHTAPTFYKDVLPLLQEHCQSCHRPGEVAPMPLVTYQQTRPWAPAIAKAVQSGIMPPWFADPRFGHFSDDPSLNPQQIATLLAWVAGG